MISTSWQRRLFAFLCAALFAMLLPALGNAAVPHEDAHPAYAEEQTIRQVEQGKPEPGWSSSQSGIHHFDRNYLRPPGVMSEQEVILQRGGNMWRNLRNGPIASIAGALLLVVPILIFGFYHAFGAAKTVPESGRKIERFSRWDRLIHWSTAITFIILAITGIIFMFGKQIMLPWMGHTVFSWFAIIGKYLHNFVGPLFILCSILMFVNWVRENVFNRWDWQWLKRGGGIASHEHIPAGYFNAGEKLWFWFGVTLLGLIMSITGLMLNFPYFYEVGANTGLTRYQLQMADYLHIAAGTLYMILTMGHIYIGVWGTPGAYQAMRHGVVDEEWARAHHELWYNEMKGIGPDPDMPPASPRPMPPDAAPRPGA
jgi:formate dehydrogenase subunit gamma